MAAIAGSALLAVAGVMAWMLWPHPYPLSLVVGGPGQIEYRFVDEGARAQEETLRDLVESAESLIGGYAGGHLASLTIVAGADQASLAQAAADAVGAEEASVELENLRVHHFIPLGTTVYLDISEGLDAYSYDLVALSVATAFQQAPLWAGAGAGRLADCAGLDPALWTVGPVWLYLGMPDYVRTEAQFDSGYWERTHGSSPDVGRSQIIAAGYAGTDRSLEALSSYDAWLEAPEGQALYDLSYAGISLLTGRAGIRALFEYWQRLGDGECLKPAFEHAFGISLDDFEDSFEGQRPGHSG